MNVLGNLMLVLGQAEAALTVQDSTPPVEPGMMATIVPLLIVVAIFVIPFVLGQLAERALRLKDVAFRIGVVLFAITLSLTPFVSRYIQDKNLDKAFRLGIDLAGGMNVTYEIDKTKAKAADSEFVLNNNVMQKMVDAIGRRVNPSGLEEVTVRQVGNDRIEVIRPGVDQEGAEQIKKQITALGSLEFSVLVNQTDHPQLYAVGLRQQNDFASKLAEGGGMTARWVPVAKDKDGIDKVTGESYGTLSRVRPASEGGGREYLVLVADPEEKLTGDHLVSASEGLGGAEGAVVNFGFDATGAVLLHNLTFRYQPRDGEAHKTHLAILLSDQIHSAPTINDLISGGVGQISGKFTSAEIQELINVLNAGALEVPLTEKPVTEFTVSALLGKDVRDSGRLAITVAALAVFIFMLLYYWKAGIVADICLLVNVIMVLGIMSLINATFTLPGIAGLVLVIGMAVDANVLIFERIREEQDKGGSLRMSINNGFSKALSTIVDSNLTTIITAIVLYVIGTDQVKGFAVTLFIGIVTSMFTALYVGRLIFDIMERKQWVKSLPMASVVKTPSHDFLSKRTLCFGLSGLLIVVGMIGLFTRGQDNLDIDFRGGAMVSFGLEDPKPGIDEVRTLLEAKFGKSISVEELTLPDEAGNPTTLYRMRTVESDVAKVAEEINQSFAGTKFNLVRQHVKLGTPETIASTAPATPATEEKDPKAEAQTFEGGRRITVELSEAMSPTTLRDALLDQLIAIDDSRYTGQEEALAALVTGESDTEKYTSLVLQAKSLVTPADFDKATQELAKHLEAEPFFVEKNTFSAAVGDEMKWTAIKAAVISLACIVGYLWFRFHGVNFGLAAVVALVHDVLAVLGIVALASYLGNSSFGAMLGLVDFKINLPMVAAFMTLIGYSLNDTIVVFDRIREVRGKNPAMTDAMINQSVNQTLSRTLLTSLTTWLVVVILYAMGGEGIHGFAFCLLMGIVVGTYSSIYVAAPVLLWLTNREQAKAAT
ncbi:MAG: protein translocase subunit SecD [Planctomycetaceae bacterium]